MEADLQKVRPTKKQRELLTFIEEFIVNHGYSPSFREIMTGKGYTSVASVALHINNLIKRGHLKKRDHSARSLEVVKVTELDKSQKVSAEQNWLVKQVDLVLEDFAKPDSSKYSQEDVLTLIKSLELLGLTDQALKRRETLDKISDSKSIA
jgi:repressor LexA